MPTVAIGTGDEFAFPQRLVGDDEAVEVDGAE